MRLVFFSSVEEGPFVFSSSKPLLSGLLVIMQGFPDRDVLRRTEDVTFGSGDTTVMITVGTSSVILAGTRTHVKHTNYIRKSQKFGNLNIPICSTVMAVVKTLLVFTFSN